MSHQELKQKSDLHVARKLWHILGVLLIVIIYNNITYVTARQLITIVTFLFILADVLRSQLPGLNRFAMTLFNPIMRDYERDSLSGTSYLFLGTFIIVLFFPRQIVTLSLLFLAFADPLASYVGILYGQDKILGRKSLQGSMAAFLACTVLAAIFYFSQNLMTERLLMVSILSGLIGAVSELIPIARLDDNFTFPLVSSFLLWGLFYLFGGF